MKYLEVTVIVPGRDVKQTYEVLCDFERYPNYSPEVRSVSVEANNGHKVSSWETNFRGGVLRWREIDIFDPDSGTISFEQIEGDIEHFSGCWKIAGEGAGSLIRFSAQFDMGIPSLSSIIDPIAEQALRENIIAILKGLFGPTVEVLPAGD